MRVNRVIFIADIADDQLVRRRRFFNRKPAVGIGQGSQRCARPKHAGPHQGRRLRLAAIAHGSAHGLGNK